MRKVLPKISYLTIGSIDIMRDIYILHCCTNVGRSQGFKVGFEKEKFVSFFNIPTHRVYKVVGC